MNGHLIAVEAVGNEWFVDQLLRIWAEGDAIFPLDPRLPKPAREAVLAEMAPSVLRTADGTETALVDGWPVLEGDALVIATSGSSGDPKGVVHTHDSLEASARITHGALGVDPAIDRWLACLPLAHIGGFSVVARALVTQTALEVGESPSAAVISAGLAAGATRCSLVPAALERLDTQAFTTVLLGGSAIPVDRPSNSIATYGSTETGSGVVYDGRALDGVELRVADGIISVKSPTLGRAYRDGEPIADEDGFFVTGDTGKIDADDLLVVWGRAGDVIVTGGEKVWPAKVEIAIGAHPDVAAVAVVGRADSRWGEAVEALIVVEAGRSCPSLATVRSLVKLSLPAFAAPHRVYAVEALPRLPVGKLDRRRL